MIIRKPYAFLIKKFKLIHGILSVLILYLMISTYSIFSFYNDYAGNSFISTTDLVSTYINIFMFLICIIVIVCLLAIYYLLDKKKKPNKIYVFGSILYCLLFILFIIMIVFFQSIEYNDFSYEKRRIIRDILGLFLMPQVIVFIVCVCRTLGFNLKEFDFKKDLRDLEIDEKDYEEVELTLGKDNYKYKRALRKSLRLFKYFIYENKFFVTMICSIFALIMSLTVFLNLRIYNIHYDEKQEFIANSIFYTANGSYLAYKDIYGSVITKDKYYLLINITLRNKLNSDIEVSRNTFRLNIDGELVLPKFTFKEQFLDVGQTFTECTLTSGEQKDVVVVFELTESQIKKKEYILKVKNASYLSVANLKSEYVDLVIKPENINKDEDTITYTIPNNIDLSNTILGNSSIYVSLFDIADSFKEKYENCYNDSCSSYTYIVKPTGKGNAVLKIKSEVNVDNTKYISKYIKYPSYFYKYFSTIIYRNEGETKKIKTNIIESTYGTDKYTYIEVPEKIVYSDQIRVLIDIRGVKYNLILK